ncbi:hypothetical protein F4814DRAFT_452643 [Daldinia grandis]|nr:hypothetical protein F4814DRAFT_452643 [Daldinia grandis]
MSNSSAIDTSTEDANSRKKEEKILIAQDNSSNGSDVSQDIDLKNEVPGLKLLLIHISLCLCTFLVGLVRMCASQPLAGKSYTLCPKKHALLTYLLVFELGSLACALAQTSNALIVGRAVPGLGASGIFAGGLTIVTTMIPLRKRPICTGT